MSDPRQDATLDVAGRSYLIRFTASALAQAEKMASKTVIQLALTVASGHLGMTDLLALTTAGLEGARRKLRLGSKPWTVEDASDILDELLDDGGTVEQVAQPVAEAFDAAMSRWFPAEEEPDAVDPPMAAGTGMDSSEPPSE